MTDTDAADLVPHESTPTKRPRWPAVLMLVGLGAVGLAAATTLGDVEGKALPGPGQLAAALALHTVALVCAGHAWVTLFPAGVDRRALVTSFYASQLTKYLPVGGLVQVASQVALTGQATGLGAAALRLPVFSLCTVAAGALFGSGLMFSSSLPLWARMLAGLGVLVPFLLHRRVLAFALRAARRVVKKLPDPSALPQQSAILRAFAFSLGNMAAYAAAFTVLVSDLADVDPFVTAAALCAAWVVGYLVVPLPSGVGVREAILIAALPGLDAGTLLAASLAHRLLAIAAEAGVASTSRLIVALRQRRTI